MAQTGVRAIALVAEVGSLPGEAAIDEGLLDQAVAELNRIYVVKGLEAARALGACVLDAFFSGDLALFKARQRGHSTFRALAERQDLRVAYTTIWYSTAVIEQLSQLPEALADALPITHHKLLLPVEDLELKRQIAERAVAEGLSSRELSAVVKESRSRAEDDGPRRGRPPLPAFVKAVNRFQHALELATSEDITVDSFKHFGTEDARKLIRSLDEQMAQLADLRSRIVAATDARDATT